MVEPAAALRPLREADDAIRRLEAYDTAEDLSSALETVAAAIDRSLRLRLRAEPGAADSQRLAALSSTELPSEELVRALRSLDLISLELAGTVHGLRPAVERARSGDARRTDADLAIRAVDLIRTEFRETASPPGRPGSSDETPAATDAAPAAHVNAAPAADVNASPAAEVPPERRGRWMAWLAAGVAVLFVLLLAWVLVRGTDSDYRRAVGMFRAGRVDSAAVMFQQVLEDRPRHVSSMLYLGRIHRRQGELAEAAGVLRAAVAEAPGDADVRRELGHLFMDLEQYPSAVTQYERAVEYGPDQTLNWVGLIRALRAAGDPRADRLLRDAPDEVRTMLERAD